MDSFYFLMFFDVFCMESQGSHSVFYPFFQCLDVNSLLRCWAEWGWPHERQGLPVNSEKGPCKDALPRFAYKNCVFAYQLAAPGMETYNVLWRDFDDHPSSFIQGFDLVKWRSRWMLWSSCKSWSTVGLAPADWSTKISSESTRNNWSSIFCRFTYSHFGLCPSFWSAISLSQHANGWLSSFVALVCYLRMYTRSPRWVGTGQATCTAASDRTVMACDHIGKREWPCGSMSMSAFPHPHRWPDAKSSHSIEVIMGHHTSPEGIHHFRNPTCGWFMALGLPHQKPANCTGQLLGMDVGNVLQLTHSFGYVQKGQYRTDGWMRFNCREYIIIIEYVDFFCIFCSDSFLETIAPPLLGHIVWYTRFADCMFAFWGSILTAKSMQISLLTTCEWENDWFSHAGQSWHVCRLDTHSFLPCLVEGFFANSLLVMQAKLTNTK